MMSRADPSRRSSRRPRAVRSSHLLVVSGIVLVCAVFATCSSNGGIARAQGGPSAAPCCDVSGAVANKPFWTNLFDTSDFPQRWYCGHWTPLLGWMHIIADLAIWGAYTAIPVVLCFFIRRRRDMPFPMIFWLFSVFILACGTGHFVEATIFWQPWYRLSALVKIGTALVSWLTVIALIPVLPKALALPGLAKVNQELQSEITERQRAEAALRQSEERYRQTIDTALDAVITIDGRGIITDWSGGAVDIFGWSREQALRRRLSKTIIPPHFREAHERGLGHFLATGQGHVLNKRFEITALHRTGREFPVELAITPIRANGDVWFCAFVRDITLRKSSEEALRNAKESLEKKNRRLAELYHTAHRFVDNVSHEFRTPLTVVKEFSSIIRDGLAGEVNPEQREYLDIVVSRVDDLAIMIEDMLDISKLEAGVLGVCRQDTRVEEIVDHIRPSLERKFASRQVSLTFAIDEGLPGVYCDPEKIGRVLINLVINALKVSRDGGRVELWCRFDPAQSEVLMGVTDDGPGIAAEDRQRIFERFKQIGGDPRASTKGFGLGLNIARELVHLNFGDIRVESVLGEGSTFSFSIPISDRLPLIRRYLQRVEQLTGGSAAVSLVRAQVQPTVNRARVEDVETFLQHQLRCNDLLFRTLSHQWVIVAPADRHAVNQLIERIGKAHAESNRNRMGGPMPSIDFQPGGTWRIRHPREEFMSRFESMLGMKGAIHA